MSTPARELKITYGTTVLGTGSSVYFIDAPVRFSNGPDRATVEADVIVIGTSEANFASNCTALETAFRTPRQFLEVKFGSSVHETFDASANTGFNHVPVIQKVGDTQTDTGRSRRYRVSVSCELPADTYKNTDGSTTNARRSSSITLQNTDANRKRMLMTGTYTALGGSGSRAQYNANIANYVSGILTGFGGTWEGPFDPQVSTDDQDKICNFSFVYEELIYNQSVGVLDDPNLRRQRMTVTRTTDTPGDSPINGTIPRRLQRVHIDYSVSVDKTKTQDLQSTWSGTIKPFLVQQAQAVADSKTGYIEVQGPTFNFVENTISASVTFVSVPGGTLLAARVTTDDAETTGVFLMPVWSGDRMAKYRFEAPATITRTITITTRELGLPMDASIVGQAGGSDVIGGIGANPPPGGLAKVDSDVSLLSNQQGNGGSGQGLAAIGMTPEPLKSPDGGDLTRVLLGVTRSSTPIVIGPVGDQQLYVTDRTIVARYEYYVEPDLAKPKTITGVPQPLQRVAGAGPPYAVST